MEEQGKNLIHEELNDNEINDVTGGDGSMGGSGSLEYEFKEGDAVRVIGHPEIRRAYIAGPGWKDHFWVIGYVKRPQDTEEWRLTNHYHRNELLHEIK